MIPVPKKKITSLKKAKEKYSKKLEIAPRTIVVLLAVEEEKKDAPWLHFKTITRT